MIVLLDVLSWSKIWEIALSHSPSFFFDFLHLSLPYPHVLLIDVSLKMSEILCATVCQHHEYLSWFSICNVFITSFDLCVAFFKYEDMLHDHFSPFTRKRGQRVEVCGQEGKFAISKPENPRAGLNRDHISVVVEHNTYIISIRRRENSIAVKNVICL